MTLGTKLWYVLLCYESLSRIASSVLKVNCYQWGSCVGSVSAFNSPLEHRRRSHNICPPDSHLSGLSTSLSSLVPSWVYRLPFFKSLVWLGCDSNSQPSVLVASTLPLHYQSVESWNLGPWNMWFLIKILVLDFWWFLIMHTKIRILSQSYFFVFHQVFMSLLIRILVNSWRRALTPILSIILTRCYRRTNSAWYPLITSTNCWQTTPWMCRLKNGYLKLPSLGLNMIKKTGWYVCYRMLFLILSSFFGFFKKY